MKFLREIGIFQLGWNSFLNYHWLGLILYFLQILNLSWHMLEVCVYFIQIVQNTLKLAEKNLDYILLFNNTNICIIKGKCGLVVWDGTSMLEVLRSKARGLPSVSSSLHWAYLVRDSSPMWFASYYIWVEVLPYAHPKSNDCGFPLSSKKRREIKIVFKYIYVYSWDKLKKGWKY